MKVIVLWEDPVERSAAETLAMVVNKIGTTFQNARVINGGTAIMIQQGPTYPVSAVTMPFEALANPEGAAEQMMGIEEYQRRRAAREAHKNKSRTVVRQLIFDVGDDE